MVAITSRLRSRWPLTALATPTPPTRSAVSPTSVRYCVKRSTFCSSAGEALLRLRISQPASGKLACAAVVDCRHGGVAAAAAGKLHAVMPAHEAAGLDQLGRAQRVVAHQQPRAETDAAGELVRLGRERGADFDRGCSRP